MSEKIKVVLLEPGKLARTAEIDASLAGMQKTVGGLIEPFYPFEEQVCIVCNEESKINGMRPNRSVKNDDGVMVDFIFGPAFICDCRGENLDSLSDEQTARAATKATAAGIKAAVKATTAAVKAIIAGTKALIAAIAAGGWVAVVIILVICVIGLIVGSCFGIFFSGEDSGTGQTMRQAVQEINADYQSQIDTTRANLTYDELEMSGSRAVWPEVLAVYAVKATTDPDDPQEVATVDDSKKAILKDIFWRMNEISSRTESKTEEVITETDDGHGNIVETATTVTRTYLYITVSHKTAEEMADNFNFTADQRKQLSELLDEENRRLWSAVLYGIYSGDDAIVKAALSQVGNAGGEPYWSWYGFNSRVEWCACFVSWCFNECGYLDTGTAPKFAGCVGGVEWFRSRSNGRIIRLSPLPA